MRVTAKDATLLTMRIASLDLVLRSRHRSRVYPRSALCLRKSATADLRGGVSKERSFTLLFQLYVSAYGGCPGHPAEGTHRIAQGSGITGSRRFASAR